MFNLLLIFSENTRLLYGCVTRKVNVPGDERDEACPADSPSCGCLGSAQALSHRPSVTRHCGMFRYFWLLVS